MTYTAVSLFSGTGVFDYGVSLAGFDIQAQVEIEPFCRKVLEKHKPRYWPNSTILEDVRNAGRHNLPANPAFCYGGFPCTDISVAGKQAGITPETRSGLWFEFARIIGEIRPRYVLLENVPAITGNGGLTVIGQLTSLGYDCEWGIISAADAGAPHLRERWWCVAHADRMGRNAGRTGDAGSSHGEQHASTGKSIQLAEQPGTSPYGSLLGDTQGQQRERSFNSRSRRAGFADRSPVLAHPDSQRQQQPQGTISQFRGWSEYGSKEQRGVGQADAYGQSPRYGHNGALGLFPNGLSQDEGRGSSLPDQNNGDVESIVCRATIRTASGVDERLWPARPGEAQRSWERPRTTKTKVPDRASRLKALGNSGIWQIVYALATEIREALAREDNAAAAGGR